VKQGKSNGHIYTQNSLLSLISSAAFISAVPVATNNLTTDFFRVVGCTYHEAPSGDSTQKNLG